MRFYLASRYSRRVELCEYKAQLESVGHVVEARWLSGDHQISDVGTPIGENGEKLVEGDDGSTDVRSMRLRSKFAEDDFQDVIGCDALIAFTEPPRSEFSRGGRHVELGIALGLKKPVIVVGHRENIFCWLDGVVFCESFSDVLAFLDRERQYEENLSTYPTDDFRRQVLGLK